MRSNAEEWHTFARSDRPLVTPLPAPFTSRNLTRFQRLMILRSLGEDEQLLRGMANLVAEELGPKLLLSQSSVLGDEKGCPAQDAVESAAEATDGTAAMQDDGLPSEKQSQQQDGGGGCVTGVLERVVMGGSASPREPVLILLGAGVDAAGDVAALAAKLKVSERREAAAVQVREARPTILSGHRRDARAARTGHPRGHQALLWPWLPERARQHDAVVSRQAAGLCQRRRPSILTCSRPRSARIGGLQVIDVWNAYVSVVVLE